MLGKNGLHIRIQPEKCYQDDKLFYLGFENVLKMQASVIHHKTSSKKQEQHSCDSNFRQPSYALMVGNAAESVESAGKRVIMPNTPSRISSGHTRITVVNYSFVE